MHAHRNIGLHFYQYKKSCFDIDAKNWSHIELVAKSNPFPPYRSFALQFTGILDLDLGISVNTIMGKILYFYKMVMKVKA